MDLTVAICSYRRFDWLKKCLDYLQKQTLPADEFRVVIVDNSLLPAESEAFRDSLCSWPNLEYIIAEEAGLSLARNTALEACRTPFIAFIDDDALVAPDWAEKLIDAFRRYPAAGIIGGRIDPIWEADPPEWLQGALMHALAVLDWGEEELFIFWHEKRWLVGANVAYRTGVLRRAGGFDPALGRRGDLLLCHEELAANLAVQSLGYDALYVPSVRVDHLIQAERTTAEWFLRHAFWEGVSRAVYESGIKDRDLNDLSEHLQGCFSSLQKKYPPRSLPRQTEKLLSIMGEVNLGGRRSCLDYTGAEKSAPDDSAYSRRLPVIYIVTPCLNAVETIDRAILSVVGQAGDFSIRYHLQDGGSTDGTLEKIKKWEQQLSSPGFPVQCNNIVFTWQSAPDDSMYEALDRGFKTMALPPDSFMTWINADDQLMPGAFALVNQVASLFRPEDVSWLSGATAVFKENHQIVHFEKKVSTSALREGLCDGVHWGFLQQEGTFFRAWLWKKVKEGAAFRGFRYSGDWNLWRLMARHARLNCLHWSLGAFYLRAGQLSAGEEYKAEIDRALGREERALAFKELMRNKEFTIRILRTVDYPRGRFVVIERGVNQRAARFYRRIFGSRPGIPIYEEDEKPRIICSDNSGGVLNLLEEDLESINLDPGLVVPVDEEKKDGRRGLSVQVGEKDFRQALAAEDSGEEPCPAQGAACPVIHVVTPCLNAAATIDRTILSVISQAGNFFIHYHLQDGGSTDETMDIVDYWKDALQRRIVATRCRGIRFTSSSGPDRGLYDAVIKGFAALDAEPDDFMTWINSDDIILSGAFAAVCALSANFPRVDWVGSPQYVIDMNGDLLLERATPTPTALIEAGICDGRHYFMLQQEGTFFRKSLWFRASHALEGFELAGDWNLWREMARHAQYHQHEKPLGAFRRRKGQLSIARYDDYMAEIERALPLETRSRRFQRFYFSPCPGALLIREGEGEGGLPAVVEEQEKVQELIARFSGDKSFTALSAEQNAAMLFAYGEEALENMDYPGAAAFYRTALDLDQKGAPPEAYTNLYIACRNLGQGIEAGEVLGRGMKKHPGRVGALYGEPGREEETCLDARRVAADSGFLTQGEEGTKYSLETKPLNQRGYNNRGLFLHTLHLLTGGNAHDRGPLQVVEKITTLKNEFLFYRVYHPHLAARRPSVVPDLYAAAPLGHKYFQVFVQYLPGVGLVPPYSDEVAAAIGEGLAGISLLDNAPIFEMHRPNEIDPELLGAFSRRQGEIEGEGERVAENELIHNFSKVLPEVRGQVAELPPCPAHDDLFWRNMVFEQDNRDKPGVVFIDWGSFISNRPGSDLFMFLSFGTGEKKFRPFLDRILETYLKHTAGHFAPLDGRRVLLAAAYNAAYHHLLKYLRFGEEYFAAAALETFVMLEVLAAEGCETCLDLYALVDERLEKSGLPRADNRLK